MKKNLVIICMATLVMVACSKKNPAPNADDINADSITADTIVPETAVCEFIPNAVTDIDGNTYNAVKIGEQVWMAENLRTTRYADGTRISSNTGGSAFRSAPNFDESTISRYGYLYNWYATMHGSSASNKNPSGVQGVCPNGWHVPSDAEWNQFSDYMRSQSEYICGETEYSFAKALASDYGWWDGTKPAPPCTPGDASQPGNETGFSALPAGEICPGPGEVQAYGFGKSAIYWSATIDPKENICGRAIEYGDHRFNQRFTDLFYVYSYAYSVRCLKNL